jgi:hypothetical protein
MDGPSIVSVSYVVRLWSLRLMAVVVLWSSMTDGSCCSSWSRRMMTVAVGAIANSRRKMPVGFGVTARLRIDDCLFRLGCERHVMIGMRRRCCCEPRALW